MGTLSELSDWGEDIRNAALQLGFSACGFASVADVAPIVYNRWKEWIADGKHDTMQYMERYGDIRLNPQGLLPNARSIISVALNYYPSQRMPDCNPRFAFYAYGQDYHTIVRQKLQALQQYIQSLVDCECRICCDTAPIFERYWAQKAGLGFIGRNSQLIIPGKGSCFFLGELITTLDLPASTPVEDGCGTCRRCIDGCPVRAIGEDGMIDARRCISCQTIENRNEIPVEVAERMGRRVYGCDTCQELCPYNKEAEPTDIIELKPSAEFESLNYERLRTLTADEFAHIFRHSAVKRVKYAGLMRNVEALNKSLFEK